MSISINVNHSLCKGLRRSLRQIVANGAADDPVCILAGEFLTISGLVGRVWRTSCITFKGICRHGDDRKLSELLCKFVMLRFAFSQPSPKAITVNHEGDVIRIVDGCRCALECGIIEVLLERGDLPNELRKIAAVFVIAGSGTLSSKIVLDHHWSSALGGSDFLLASGPAMR